VKLHSFLMLALEVSGQLHRPLYPQVRRSWVGSRAGLNVRGRKNPCPCQGLNTCH